MSRFNCPLCCQQEFDSVKTLREHLLYYKYRPIMCVLCGLTCNGISNLISHLETHLGTSSNFGMCGEKPILNILDKSKPVCNKNYSLSNSSVNISINKNQKIPQRDQPENDNGTNLENSLASTQTCDVTLRKESCQITSKKEFSTLIRSDNSLLPNQNQTSESISNVHSLSIRAYTCEKCGLKIVGKDSYFHHLQNGHSENFKPVQKFESLPNLDKSSVLLNSKNPVDQLNWDVLHYMQHATHTDNLHKEANDDDDISNSLMDINIGNKNYTVDMYKKTIAKDHPYIHKKFDHDQERQAEVMVQHYKNTYQSFLISKLNKSLDNLPQNELVLRNTCKSFQNVAEIPDRTVKSTVTLTKQRLFESNKYKCSLCNKYFTKQSLRTKHLKEFHVKMIFSCSSCNFTFSSKRDLDNHAGMHNNKLKKCNICKYSCRTGSGLRTHIFEKHSTNRKCMQCHLCKETFKKKYSFDRHMQRFHGDNNYICDYCGKSYKWEDDFRNHVVSHSDKMVARCNQCNKLFKSRFALKRHTSSLHTKDISYKCKYCGKTFARSDILVKHTKLHKTIFKY